MYCEQNNYGEMINDSSVINYVNNPNIWNNYQNENNIQYQTQILNNSNYTDYQNNYVQNQNQNLEVSNNDQYESEEYYESDDDEYYESDNDEEITNENNNYIHNTQYEFIDNSNINYCNTNYTNDTNSFSYTETQKVTQRKEIKQDLKLLCAMAGVIFENCVMAFSSLKSAYPKHIIKNLSQITSQIRIDVINNDEEDTNASSSFSFTDEKTQNQENDNFNCNFPVSGIYFRYDNQSEDLRKIMDAMLRASKLHEFYCSESHVPIGIDDVVTLYRNISSIADDDPIVMCIEINEPEILKIINFPHKCDFSNPEKIVTKVKIGEINHESSIINYSVYPFKFKMSTMHLDNYCNIMLRIKSEIIGFIIDRNTITFCGVDSETETMKTVIRTINEYSDNLIYSQYLVKNLGVFFKNHKNSPECTVYIGDNMPICLDFELGDVGYMRIFQHCGYINN